MRWPYELSSPSGQPLTSSAAWVEHAQKHLSDTARCFPVPLAFLLSGLPLLLAAYSSTSSWAWLVGHGQPE